MAPQNNSMGDPNLPLWIKMLTAGLAGSWAEIMTIPLDTAKVRLQIQAKQTEGVAPKYSSMSNCIKTMIKEEGLFSLYKGLNAGLQRQMVFASIRIGLYEPVRNLMVPKEQQLNPSFFYKVLAGFTTGAIGIMVANPTDVVKVRLQAEGRLPEGVPKRYNGVMDAYRKIIAQEGLAGLWTGIGPNIARNGVINAAELATYDQMKQVVVGGGYMGDNIGAHLVCSSVAGFVAAFVGSPVDVTKTRIMQAKPGVYNGVLDCVVKTIRNDGLLAFYNGFSANANRIVTWNIFMFVTLQQLRLYSSNLYFKDQNNKAH